MPCTSFSSIGNGLKMPSQLPSFCCSGQTLNCMDLKSQEPEAVYTRMDSAIMLHDILNIVWRARLCSNWGLPWRKHVMNLRNIEGLISVISHHSHQTFLMVGCGYNRLTSPHTHCVKTVTVNTECPHNISWLLLGILSHCLFYRLKLQDRNTGLFYASA